MKKINQKIEAAEFIKRNEETCEKVKKALLEAGTHLIENKVKDALPEPVLKEAQKALAESDLSRLFRAIRTQSDLFGESGHALRYAFWSLIDGINFFFDATGSFWPYVTQQNREYALKWAEDNAQNAIATSI